MSSSTKNQKIKLNHDDAIHFKSSKNCFLEKTWHYLLSIRPLWGFFTKKEPNIFILCFRQAELFIKDITELKNNNEYSLKLITHYASSVLDKNLDFTFEILLGKFQYLKNCSRGNSNFIRALYLTTITPLVISTIFLLVYFFLKKTLDILPFNYTLVEPNIFFAKPPETIYFYTFILSWLATFSVIFWKVSSDYGEKWKYLIERYNKAIDHHSNKTSTERDNLTLVADIIYLDMWTNKFFIHACSQNLERAIYFSYFINQKTKASEPTWNEWITWLKSLTKDGPSNKMIKDLTPVFDQIKAGQLVEEDASNYIIEYLNFVLDNDSSEDET